MSAVADLSRRLGRAIGTKATTADERAQIHAASLQAKSWAEFPVGTKALVEAIEARPDQIDEPVTNVYRIHGRPAHGLPYNINPADFDLSKVQRDWERQLKALLGKWRDITADQINEIADRVRSAISANDVRSLITLAASPAAASAALIESMNEMATAAAEQMAREIEAQGAPPVDPVAGDPDQLAASAVALATLLAGGLANAGAREALRRWGPGASGDAVAASVKEHLTGLSTSFAEANLGGALTAAQNSGRFATMRAMPEIALYANEVLDTHTCKPCQHVDGKWLGNASDMSMVLRLYPNGGYVDCLGGPRCRGTVVAVWRPAQVSSEDA